MSNRRLGLIASYGATLCAAIAIGCAAAAAEGTAQTAAKPVLPGVPAGTPVAVETVIFGDRGLPPVRLLRGPVATRTATPQLRSPPRPAARPVALPWTPPAPPISTQLVSFGDGTATRVTVIRGGALPVALARQIDPLARSKIETVSFNDPRIPAVTVMRGPSARDPFAVDLFGPADGGELDRIAFAVDGVESRHGADLRMWRPEYTGPQGPMQVSLAAALDVGGGNRFDLRENRLLGRAYLAQMFQRYGNWPDAVAAYNWGPGAMDQWIAGGRNSDKLPFGVMRYVDMVLRNALITTARR